MMTVFTAAEALASMPMKVKKYDQQIHQRHGGDFGFGRSHRCCLLGWLAKRPLQMLSFRQ